MPVLWEWVGSRSYEKSLTRFVPAPSSGAYGTPVWYDQEPPNKTAQLKADLVPSGDADTEAARLDTASNSVTYTLASGGTITGVPVSFSRDQIPGTTRENIRVTIQIVT